ncbi:RDD family protein [Lysobacter pythonis]|uniref:RDD family protein n=1 Tax=Solilutibacter pythonis TaxID=2483112 RepID=A0A3M2HH59_9GAMM|nr:RDD family protein [Lysobacter pythonis]RMH87755.1 RDD family protein [Lysobacter pythonis]
MVPSPPPAHRPLIGWRFLALLYDFFPMLGIWFVIAALSLGLHGGVEIRSDTLAGMLEFIALLAITGLYATASWRRGGQTIGMKPWRLYVVTPAGDTAPFGRLWRRYLAGVLSFSCAGLGFWWAWLDRDGLTWHDRLSGTRMIRDFQRDALREARKR